MPAPKPTLVARTFGGALLAARQQGNTLCYVTLTGGQPFLFDLHDTIDDALIGNRPETPGKAALIPYHAIAMIEFGG